MSALNITDRIDAYLSGQMSPEEQKQFEDLLEVTSQNSTHIGILSDEVNLQKELIMAIRERALKEQLQATEQHIRIKQQMLLTQMGMKEKEKSVVFYRKVSPVFLTQMEDTKKQYDKTRKRIHRWKIAGISIASMAVAAAICLCIILIPTMHTMRQISTQFALSVNIEPMRGTMLDPIEKQLEQTYQYIASEQWSEAAAMASALMEQTAEPLPTMSHEECQEIHEQAQWIYTLCEMHRGHIFRAKRLLRQIAADGGLYAPQAKQYLDQL